MEIKHYIIMILNIIVIILNIKIIISTRKNNKAIDKLNKYM